jgi:hypothetical protein
MNKARGWPVRSALEFFSHNNLKNLVANNVFSLGFIHRVLCIIRHKTDVSSILYQEQKTAGHVQDLISITQTYLDNK